MIEGSICGTLVEKVVSRQVSQCPVAVTNREQLSTDSSFMDLLSWGRVGPFFEEIERPDLRNCNLYCRYRAQ